MESPQISALIPPVDLDARVVYFPVRHHSPACAWHVARLIRQLKPESVLIEGPRDATALIPLLINKQTAFPVAIYTTYVERAPDVPPNRHAAYYPLCEYSPELAAICAAAEVGASAEFMDLTFPEMIVAGRRPPEKKTLSLLDEHALRYSRFLQSACAKAGVRDPDELWDHLYEVDYQKKSTADFMREVLAYCALARQDQSTESLTADGTLARESAMAAAISRQKGRVVVVTGGFHTVALPHTSPAMPAPIKIARDDALVVLMRYGFEQLDHLNGYASGMPSPEFYQRQWEDRSVASLFVELGRLCRKRRHDISVADEIAALNQCQLLAQLRGHARPSRMDVQDGVRSAFVKGAADSDGLMVLAIMRQYLAGDRIGRVPKEAGLPPIVTDFRDTAERLKIDLDRIDARECSLDLYRRANHREMSRFFHRLRFLQVPFAKLIAGPDFVAGKDLERIQEIWKYHWSPDCESMLIERSLYGPNLEDASSALLMEQFTEAETRGQGHRADVAATLLLEACRMGLHRQTPDLLRRTAALVQEDGSFISLVDALNTLVILHTSREPLEAHHLTGIDTLSGIAYERAAYLIPSLAATPEQEERHALEALNAFSHTALNIGDTELRHALRRNALRSLLDAQPGLAVMRGAAAGLLFGDGAMEPDELTHHFRGHLLSMDENGSAGCNFLRGLLATARSVLWQVPDIIAAIHSELGLWDEERFVRLVPQLRLAMADLTPQECDQIAQAVALHAGVKKLEMATSSVFSSFDMATAVDINRRVDESLRRDQLADWSGGHTHAG